MAAQLDKERMQRTYDADTKTGFLFEEDGTTMRAVARDDVGIHLPDCDRGWRFVQALELDLRHVISAGLDPQAAISSLLGEGFYMWDAGKAS